MYKDILPCHELIFPWLQLWRKWLQWQIQEPCSYKRCIFSNYPTVFGNLAEKQVKENWIIKNKKKQKQNKTKTNKNNNNTKQKQQKTKQKIKQNKAKKQKNKTKNPPNFPYSFLIKFYVWKFQFCLFSNVYAYFIYNMTDQAILH